MKLNKTGMLVILVAAGVVTAASAQTPAPAAKPMVAATPAPAASNGVAVTPAAIAKVAAMVPPASATTSKSDGKGGLQVNTANNAADTDSYWVASIDMDGDGNVEDTALVWDDEDKILFAYADGTFTCRNGATGAGGLIIGVNAAGNARNRPAGSGFWAAEIDKSECASATAGIVGCRFDASQNPTVCGMVTIDQVNDDVVIVTASAN
jgi:hypothetical protein